MRVLISPAKKMRVDTDSFAAEDLPAFLDRAEILADRLREMTYPELKALWKCSDQIAQRSLEQLQAMDLRKGLTPALISYEGIQYRYMAPGVFTTEELAYVREHLRILSGFYGLLRPFDGVVPYRLEMQAKLSICEAKDLYTFWDAIIAKSVLSETGCILNLASKEYSVCVSRHLSKSARWVTCIFGERKNSRIIEKGTQCKMARGEMVRFMAEERIQKVEDVRAFDRLGYRFSATDSGKDTYTFVKDSLPVKN